MAALDHVDSTRSEVQIFLWCWGQEPIIYYPVGGCKMCIINLFLVLCV